jgi:hypothetical protein
MPARPNTTPKNDQEERSQQEKAFVPQLEYVVAKEALFISMMTLKMNRTVANGHDSKDHQDIGHIVKIEIGIGVDSDRCHDGKRGDAESHGKGIMPFPPQAPGLVKEKEKAEA